MATAMMVVALISGVALILSVMFQTSKAESFSAAMGGGSSDTRFKPGSKEEWLYKITKFSAVVWLVSCTIGAYVWYHSQ